MQFKITLLLCLVVLSAGCKTNSGDVIDLSKRLVYAEKSDDLQLILFGRPEGKRFLLSGWSEFQRDGNEKFQWASSNKTAFFFKTSRVEPLFLHIKLGSLFPNSAQVFLNKKPLGRIQVNEQAEVHSIRLPSEAMQLNANVIEFDWNELRQFSSKRTTRELAAAAYFAAITPAKHLTENLEAALQNINSGSALLDVAGKKRPSLTFPLGGTVRFYEKLSKDSKLEFGMYYDPPALSEEDDFADFTITLRRDRQPEQQVFQKRAAQKTASHESIPLSKFVTGAKPEIYEIEFKVKRNSILNGGKAAWTEPILYQGFSKQNYIPNQAIEEIRKANAGANVIVIILDAAGAKHLSTYGYHRKTTPNIEKLVQEGVQFENAYCQAVYTLASTASLMSGLDPYRHRVVYRRNKLPEETYTLAERFANSGYETGTFIANGNASTSFGMTQGFDEIREVFREPNYTGWGSDITNRFTQWLDRLNSGDSFFAYVHYREPHGPFNPPESFKKQFTDPNYKGYENASDEMRKKIRMGEVAASQADRDFITASYDENLRYGDYEVGRVIKKLKEMKLYDRTIILITADHGEAFWEHEFQGHNSQLYEESIHIPMIVKLASTAGVQQKRIKTPVGTIDIYPSLVDLLGLSQKNWNLDGRSFVPYLVSANSEDVPILSQTISEQAFAYKEGNFKYIYHRHTGTEELYDLKSDPDERTNLTKTHLIQGAYLRSRLFGWQSSNAKAGARVKTERAVVDETTGENLKSLGYMYAE